MRKIIMWALTLALTVNTLSVMVVAEDDTQLLPLSEDEVLASDVLLNGYEVDSDDLDDLDDLSKVYTSSNLTSGTTNVLSEGNGVLTITDDNNLGNIVYKAVDGKLFGTVSVQIMKHYSVSIKYPVISYSDDGINYTPLTTVMSETGGNPAEWERSQSAVNDYWLYNCSVAVPDGAKYVKVEISANSTTTGETYKYKIDKVNLSMALEPVEIATDLIDECEELTNLWSSKNMVQGDESGFGDDTTWKPGNATQQSEVVYKAVAGKSISKIVVNITRSGMGVKFPVISYSTDGENYIDMTEVMANTGYGANGWVRDETLGGNDAQHKYRWPARATIELPVGAIYVKLWIQAASGDIWIEDITLDVGKIGVLSDDSYVETFENLDYVHSLKNITLNGNAFDAANDGEILYMIIPGRGADSFQITSEQQNNVNSVTVCALNSAQQKILDLELSESWNGNDCTISGNFPEGTRYVVLKNDDAVTYTMINITTKVADTYDWVSIVESPIFTLGEDGTMSVKADVRNDSGVTMRVSGYHLVYDKNKDLKKIESDVKYVDSGKTEEVCVPAFDYGQTDTSKFILLSDVENAIVIGSTEISQVLPYSEPVIDYRFSNIDKGEITITGKGIHVSAQDNKVSVIVLNPTYTRTNADNAPADTAINNMAIAEVKPDGSFSVNMRLRNPVYEKTYNVVVRSAGMVAADESLSITYNDPNELAEDIAAKIKEGDKLGLEALLTSGNMKIIGVRTDKLNDITATKLSALFDEKPDTLVENTMESVRHSLEGRALLEMIKNGTAEKLIKDAFSDNDCLDILTSGKIKSAPANIFRTLNDESKVAAKLNNNTYSNMKDLDDAFALVVLNEAIKSASTNLSARAVMKEYREGGMFTTNYIDSYNDLNNTNRAKAENALIASVKNKEFTFIDDAAQRFENYIYDTSNNDGSSTGLGGGAVRPSKGGMSVGIKVGVDHATLNQATTTKTENKPFMDIEDVPWAEESILALFDKGVISGRERLKFEPHGLVTREEYIKMIVLALGIESEDPKCSFDDVLSNDWFYSYVAHAYTSGIINGVTEVFFGSGSNITREDMVAILYRAAQYKGIKLNDADLTFDDEKVISDYAKKAIGALSKIGVVSGKGNNCFEPKATATRAEAAKIIYTLIKNSGI